MLKLLQAQVEEVRDGLDELEAKLAQYKRVPRLVSSLVGVELSKVLLALDKLLALKGWLGAEWRLPGDPGPSPKK